MARLLFVFLDGVGLGSVDASRNPLAGAWPGLQRVAGAAWTADGWREEVRPGRVRRGLDARLSRPGVPQSATGQTALLTGRNAAAVMGRHYGPWPGPTLQALLREGTLFHHGARHGGAALANAYPAVYVEALRAWTGGASGRDRRERRWRPSAPVMAALAAGVGLRDIGDFAAGRAVAADLDGRSLTRSHDGEIAPGRFEPEAQARALAELAATQAFSFLDVWSGDRAGHRQDAVAARDVVARLERFLVALVDALPDDVTLLVTSDHGNLEDAASPRHTLAPVPLLALGPHAQAFAAARSLLDVAPAARRVLASAGGEG